MLHLITILLIVLKVMEVIDWHWLIVFLPSIIPLLFLTVFTAIMGLCALASNR